MALIAYNLKTTFSYRIYTSEKQNMKFNVELKHDIVDFNLSRAYGI